MNSKISDKSILFIYSFHSIIITTTITIKKLKLYLELKTKEEEINKERKCNNMKYSNYFFYK
jgi:hypothetical protein